MTTVACNRESLACDLQFTYGGHTKFKGKTKVFVLDNELAKEWFKCKRVYIGFSGNADKWADAIGWFMYPDDKPPKLKGIEFLALTDTKKIYHASSLTNWMELHTDKFAIGSGMQFALAAMTAGKTPLQAVKIASKHDPQTGLGFQEFKHK